MTTTSPTIASPTIAWTTDGSTARSPGDDLRALPLALRSEWIKLTALRANRAILALTALVGGLVAYGLAATATDATLTASELFIYPLPLVAMMAAVAGILLFTGEAQHGTLPTTLAARPARWVIVAAKTTTAATIGLTLGATGMVAGFGGAALGGVDLGGGSALTSRALWALLYIALAALIGLGVGMIVRHSAAAITGLLLWSFVIESLFAPALPEGVRHALPFSAGYRLLDAGPNFEAPVAIAHQLARPEYALIFAGYALATLAVGTFLLYRRDAA
ncbi:ABC transporter permease subunit [Aquihabitans sp. G128]|uniref:ABC transporter permease subunit n=1 Tax=Aquihabitans sp. G128 TaxID=2849779 RepID=UPI001C2368F8|nr:ABC transporter permease subunit [Aquihabitans sp. G128]QXC60657.1 ABC transporter permease subunit [Aquihabitans sp. G128]